MNILLWILQVGVGFMTAMGAIWRFTNWQQISQMGSIKALPKGLWDVINVFEIVCALGLILPGLFLKAQPMVTPVAAACLAVELFLVTALHVRFFGFQFKKTNPGAYSFTMAVLSAFIAYGRFVLSPF